MKRRIAVKTPTRRAGVHRCKNVSPSLRQANPSLWTELVNILQGRCDDSCRKLVYLFNASRINTQLQAECNLYGDGSCIMIIPRRRFLPDGLYIGTLHIHDDDDSCDPGEVVMTPLGTLHKQSFLGDVDHFRGKLSAIGHRLTKSQQDKLHEMVTFNVDDEA